MECDAIVICFGGKWESSSDGEESYVDYNNFGISVPKDINFEDLLNAVCYTLGVDNVNCKVTLKIKIDATRYNLKPIEIRNDSDVRFFLSANRRSYCPLCVTVDPRAPVYEDNVQPLNQNPPSIHAHFMSASGSNQVSHTSLSVPAVVPANTTNEYHNVSPIPFNEDPAYTHYACDDIENVGDVEGDYDDVRNVDNLEGDDLAEGGRCYVSTSSLNVEARRIDFCEAENPFAFMPPIPPSDLGISDKISSSGIDDVFVGKLFDSKDELHQAISMVALKGNWSFKVSRSTKDRFEIKCDDDRCRWRLRAVSTDARKHFIVRRIDSSHVCQLDRLRDGHRQAKSRIIGKFIKNKFASASRLYRPKEIQADIREEFGVDLTYPTAWRSKEHALVLIRGTPEGSYKLLPAYCHILEQQNPGTVTHLEIDDCKHFKYFFMALGPCIRGFQSSIRPVIAVDGTFLKNAYLGTMFVAVCKDGNNQIFPLAWGIADSENDASWKWFMAKLRGVIGDLENLVFISDRHASIEKAIKEVFPNVYHGVCIHHLKCNLVARYKIPSHTTKGGGYLASYFVAAKAYRIADFQREIYKMREMKPEATRYLEEEVGFSKWARSMGAFRRYDIMTTNIAESINAVAKDARAMTVTALIEWIRELMQKWFVERREAAENMSNFLTTWAHDKIWKHNDDSARMTVHAIDRSRFVVKDGKRNGIVDIPGKSCSCQKFDMRQLPCPHALAVCRQVRFQYQTLCSRYYTTECLLRAYSEPVNPVGHPLDWIVPEELRAADIQPPIVRRQSGRRRKNRILSQGEAPTKNVCSRCKQHGHNRQTCRNPIPLHGS